METQTIRAWLHWDEQDPANPGWAYLIERDCGPEQESGAIIADLDESASLAEVLAAAESDLPSELGGAAWVRFDHDGGGWEARA